MEGYRTSCLAYVCPGSHRASSEARSGIDITPAHEADHIAMGMSLIASTGAVGLLPAYAQNFLPSSVSSRPLKGNAPTVDLVFGYKTSDQLVQSRKQKRQVRPYKSEIHLGDRVERTNAPGRQFALAYAESIAPKSTKYCSERLPGVSRCIR